LANADGGGPVNLVSLGDMSNNVAFVATFGVGGALASIPPWQFVVTSLGSHSPVPYFIWLLPVIAGIASAFWAAIFVQLHPVPAKIGPISGLLIALLSFLITALVLAIYQGASIDRNEPGKICGAFVVYVLGGLYAYGWYMLLLGALLPFVVRFWFRPPAA
jgi:hypothetical protein